MQALADAASDDEGDESPTLDEEAAGAGAVVVPKKQKVKKSQKKQELRAYQLDRASEVVGVLFLEVTKITDLPPEKNVTRTGFDMDPFVVVSLGKKVFRTRHVRHNLNPVFEEKMLFQVLRHEQNYSVSFTVIDKDKFSSNDFVAEAHFPLQTIAENAPAADPQTGLYALSNNSQDNFAAIPPNSADPAAAGTGGKSRFRLPLSRTNTGSSLSIPNTKGKVLTHRTSSKSLRPDDEQEESGSKSPSRSVMENVDYDLHPYVIPLPLKNAARWEDKHSPELYIKAKYIPYPALRQQFWRHMLREYDSDDNGTISRVELTTMLDTLGSTLHEDTIDSFFERFREENEDWSLEEAELTMDQAVICLEDQLNTLAQKRGDYTSNPLPYNAGDEDDLSETPTPLLKSRNPSQISLSGNGQKIPVQEVPAMGVAGEEGAHLPADDLGDGKAEEHVIQIKECPLCHQPRMNKRSEIDIVTHLATCASQDWRQVDKLVMGGFVTSSQAQRKWYSKV